MKNKRKLTRFFQILTVVLFVFSITFTGILFFACKKTEYSEIEKRKLMSFPEFNLKTLFSGEFTDNLTRYVSDNFVFRDNLVKLGFSLEDLRGIRIDGIKLYGDGEILQKENKIQSIDAPLTAVKSKKQAKETPLLGEELLDVINLDDLILNSDEGNRLYSKDC